MWVGRTMEVVEVGEAFWRRTRGLSMRAACNSRGSSHYTHFTHALNFIFYTLPKTTTLHNEKDIY